VFTVIGLALFLEALGYYFHNTIYWFFFIILYFAAIVSFSMHTYYNGMFSLFKVRG
jgi:hypothetical protein